MCGIVGAIGSPRIANTLLDGLNRLEYRGYDSAGIATLTADGVTRYRTAGRVEALARAVETVAFEGPIGIGHTRWATHGAPSRRNAHPHVSRGVAVVHNGIIENHKALRAELVAAGLDFESETDSEIIPKLIRHHRDAGLDHKAAVLACLRRLEGRFAFVAMFADLPDRLLIATADCPIVVGTGPEGVVIASDAVAFDSGIERIAFLEPRALADVGREAIALYDHDGNHRGSPDFTRRRRTGARAGDKAGFEHFMRKEIEEQPEVLSATLEALRAPGHAATFEVLRAAEAIDIVACGTSHYAGLIGGHWIAESTGLPVHNEIASEYRYRRPARRRDAAALFISQSGETADTLACLDHAARHGRSTHAIVNVPESAIARAAGHVLPTVAGPEIGVASTKAFTAQLAVFLTVVEAMAGSRSDTAAAIARTRQILPAGLRAVLEREESLAEAARAISDRRSALFLGRGPLAPLAMEGALKLKETAYIHAEGLAAGELKHGPLALVDPDMPVIVLAPSDSLRDKVLSNAEEVAARGGRILLLSDAAGIEAAGRPDWRNIELPESDAFSAPLLYAVALQLLAYHAARALGCDIDKPRNLAKSVTVE